MLDLPQQNKVSPFRIISAKVGFQALVYFLCKTLRFFSATQIHGNAIKTVNPQNNWDISNIGWVIIPYVLNENAIKSNLFSDTEHSNRRTNK